MHVEKRVTLEAPPDRVWEALTNPDLTRQYFFDCEALSDWQVGSPLIFRIVSGGQATIPVKGVIEAVEVNRYLQHSCYAAAHEHDPKKHTTVRYTLERTESGGTALHVTQGELEDEAAVQQYSGSWDHMLSGLTRLLESDEPD